MECIYSTVNIANQKAFLHQKDVTFYLNDSSKEIDIHEIILVGITDSGNAIEIGIFTGRQAVCNSKVYYEVLFTKNYEAVAKVNVTGGHSTGYNIDPDSFFGVQNEKLWFPATSLSYLPNTQKKQNSNIWLWLVAIGIAIAVNKK